MRHSPRYQGWRRALSLIPLAVLAVLGFIASCSSGGTSGTSSAGPSAPTSRATGSAAYCAAFDQLRTSVQDLTKVDVEKDGVIALQNALVRVQTNFDTFTAAAKATFGPQVDQMRASLDALKVTLQSGAGSPSAERMAAIRADAAAVAASF